MIARMQEHVVLERRMAAKRKLTERGRGHFGILPDCRVFGPLHDSIADWRERAAWKRPGTSPLISGQIGM